ncbi:MAG: DUF6261 family protein [Tannerella sp.]|jgi:hypothetical protein|nr:DUF6261 family protein [Tannerella sp.]
MLKFITLNATRLKLDDLAGLCSETIVIASQQSSSTLGTLGYANLQTFSTVNSTFVSLLHQKRSSELTPQITEKETLRDSLFSEIKRVSKTSEKSSLPGIAAAGSKMVLFLKPFWDIDKEPIMSQTAQIKLINTRYSADATLAQAATMLSLTTQVQALFTTNSALESLYNQRLVEMGSIEAPSASGMKSEVIAAYDEFCTTIEVTLSIQPSTALQTFFNEMNDIRRKYVARLPVPLNDKHTSVAPIAEQYYTGRHLTPLPRVFYLTDEGELRELIFSQDYTVTYRNNVEAGEAKLYVHGKGKYTGRYVTTFHIVRKEIETPAIIYP